MIDALTSGTLRSRALPALFLAASATWVSTGLFSCLLPGCTTAEQYANEADLEVDTLLAETRTSTLGHRADWVEQPQPAAATGKDAGAAPNGAENPDTALTAPSPPLLLDLRTALEIGVTKGREYIDRKDSLYLAGLSLTLTRYNFGPLLNSTVAALWNDSKNGPNNTRVAADFGMTQILSSGGNFSLTSGLGANHVSGKADDGNDPSYDSLLHVDLTQPLLRGAGYEVSHAALTQGERDIVYSVRDFEIFRETYSIELTHDFFDLVSRKQRLVNLDQNLNDARFDLAKAEALRQLDRNEDTDVFLARRRVINAETDLLSARADYEQAVDTFKVRIGLGSTTPVTIADEEPPYEPVHLDPDSAVHVALHNRLDLLNSVEMLEDDERNVRIARNSLLPDLGLTAGYGATAQDNSLADVFPDDTSSSAGLSLSLPLQRQAERNSYRSSQIALERARRDYELQLDNTERDILDQLRQLERAEQQVELQKQQIEQEQRAVAVTEIQYEAGDKDNRDLLDARLSLVVAQNLLIDLTTNHFIARLELLRDMGVLFIDDKGMWEP